LCARRPGCARPPTRHLRARGRPRLDSADRSRAPRRAPALRQDRACRRPLRSRPDSLGRPDLLVPSAVSGLRRSGPAPARPLAVDRSAPRRDRDDGRADDHARNLRRAPPPRLSAGSRSARGPASWRQPGVSAPAASSFTFEPLFLAFALAGAVLYWRAAREERLPRWRAAVFAFGLVLIAGALNSPLETIAAHYL